MDVDYFRSTDLRYKQDDIEMDDDNSLEEYFQNYVPLSNLPTPPLSSATSSPRNDSVDTKESYLTVAATQLANLIPQAASRNRTSPTLISTYLIRANVPLPTIALAGCILDSLSSFFVRSWRKELASLPQLPVISLPLTPPSTSPSTSSSPAVSNTTQFSFPSAGASWNNSSHSSKPEMIVLAALQIASSFVDDFRSDAKWWGGKVARDSVSAREIDATVRCMLQDIDYDLFAFAPEDVLRMQRIMMRGVEDLDGGYQAWGAGSGLVGEGCLEGV